MSSRNESRAWDFISDAFYPDWLGGLQRYSTELAEVAASRQGSVSLWTRIWHAGGDDLIRRELPDANVHSVGKMLPSRFRGLLLMVASLLGMSFGFKLRGDVRVAHTAVLGNLFLARKSPATQIYVFHASPSLEMQARAIQTGTYTVKRRLHSWALRRLELRCLSKADIIVVLSEYSRSLVASLLPASSSKVHVIPGGTKIGSSLELPSDTRSKEIVTVRRLEWRMGIDILLDAFARSELASDGWSVRIVGDGAEKHTLQRLAKSLGIESEVEFTGRVSEEQKAEILKGARFFVLPTRAHEGFGLATVEAMASGVIPIVTSVGASPEIVGRLNPLLICSPDADSLAETLRYWTRAEQESSYAALGDLSREVAASYGWPAVFAKLEELIPAVEVR